MIRVVAFGLLLSSTGFAYDSKCRLEGDDCEGVEAAQTPWVVVEHAALWRKTRETARLPAAVDAPFTVQTGAHGGFVADGFKSLRPASFFTDEFVDRVVDIAVFAQLPDLSYSLWDWAAGNEGCPPAGLAGEPVLEETETCHAFKAHMGWLNSTHFMPQAAEYFLYLHQLAVTRARDCAAMAAQFDDSGVDGSVVLQACDREALLIEAQAHHYLQDAWSMGHMWQRWGSPELGDFQQAVATGSGLVSIKAIGDAVGRASGIIHGAKAITGLADAMCAPQEGVEYLLDGELYPGVGDLFLEDLENDLSFFDQKLGMSDCAVAAMREVYLASAQSFGPAGEVTGGLDPLRLPDCFAQRATNRAIAIGASIQAPAAAVGLVSPTLLSNIRFVSREWIEALGIPDDPTILQIPLTSQLLTRVNFLVELKEGEPLIATALLGRWHADMAQLHAVLARTAVRSPESTSLAEGRLGPLLGLQPNGVYGGVPTYADPPLPWRPEPTTGGPLLPSIENAGNFLARTFVDAHIVDWCEAMTRDEPHEFSLENLRDECDSEGDGCEACERFAKWHLSSARVADPPLCAVVAPGTLLIDASFIETDSRDELARRWCSESPRIRIAATRTTIGPNHPLDLDAVVTGLADTAVAWTSSGGSIDGDGVFASGEPGAYLVEATSLELPSVRTGVLVVVRRDGDALGTFIGDSLEFDGQDAVPVGRPDTIQIRVTENGEDRLFLEHMAVGSSIVAFGNRYDVALIDGELRGDNGLAGSSLREIVAAVSGDTIAGVITLNDGGSSGLRSTIEFEALRQE